MGKNKRKVTVIFKAQLKESCTKNYFLGIPDDLKRFLEETDGVMQPLADDLFPNNYYKIKISIEDV